MAMHMVNKSIQDTGVLSALSAKSPNEEMLNEAESKDEENTSVQKRIAKPVSFVELDKSKEVSSFSNYIQTYYQNQLENKDYSKWDLNVN